MRKLQTLVLFTIISAGVSLACVTPVFRYALERWEADPYRLMVFTDGALDAEQQQTVKAFQNYEQYGYRNPPLIVEQVDVSAATNLSAKVWTQISTHRSAPCVALLYPSIMREDSVVWVDELTTPALHRIVMSPARLETATRLLAGDAAVWLMIQGDDPQTNRVVRALLDKTLKEIEETTVLNDAFIQQVKEAGEEVPTLRFSVLEVNPNDPREAVLMAMLTRLSPEAAVHSGPIVIPVFGQGRASVIMTDEFIDGSYIEQIADFFTGQCSCEVKDMNPGFDLLIPIDWVGGITKEYVFDSELPPLTTPSIKRPSSSESETVPVEKGVELQGKSGPPLFNGVLGIFILVVLGLLGFGTWLILRRK